MDLSLLDNIYRDGKSEISLVQVGKLIQGFPQVTAELLLYLRVGLHKNCINPTHLLIAAIDNFNTRGHLVLMALAVRYGAEVNQYLQSGSERPMHIAGYTVLRLIDRKVDEQLLDLAIVLLIVSGANFRLAMFDETAAVRSDITSNVARTKTKSVIDWLQTQGHPMRAVFIANDDPHLARTQFSDEEAKTYLAIILNRKDINTITPGEMPLCIIVAHANDFYNNLNTGFANVTDCILNYNNEALTKLLQKGAQVLYSQVNLILIYISLFSKSYVVTEELEKILTTCIEYGTPIDRYQYAMLSQLSQQIAENIRRKYYTPRWQKECKSGALSPEVKQLGLSLQLPIDDSSTLCNAFENYSRLDPVALTSTAVRRQENRLANERSLVGELHSNNNSTVGLICRNKALLAENIYEYPDPAIVSYRDNTGAIWCFPAEMYDQLIKHQQNPHNNEKLPARVIADLQHQQQILKQYQINPQKIWTFSRALDLLKQADNIGIDETMVNSFHQMAAHHGVAAERISGFSIEKLQDLIKYLNVDRKITGVDQPLRPLTPDHAYMTFIQIVYPILIIHKELQRDFFTRIKQI